jgi:hypothetical protein
VGAYPAPFSVVNGGEAECAFMGKTFMVSRIIYGHAGLLQEVAIAHKGNPLYAEMQVKSETKIIWLNVCCVLLALL